MWYLGPRATGLNKRAPFVRIGTVNYAFLMFHLFPIRKLFTFPKNHMLACGWLGEPQFLSYKIIPKNKVHIPNFEIS